jgi:hypothetical protein
VGVKFGESLMEILVGKVSGLKWSKFEDLNSMTNDWKLKWNSGQDN